MHSCGVTFAVLQGLFGAIENQELTGAHNNFLLISKTSWISHQCEDSNDGMSLFNVETELVGYTVHYREKRKVVFIDKILMHYKCCFSNRKGYF